MRVVIVMPAYNSSRTLELTVRHIPKGVAEEIILGDDGSTDGTAELAERLGLSVIRHERNRGYGANQKSLFDEALKRGADIVVLLHPDYQYDPEAIRPLIEPILKGEADVVLGSRMWGNAPREGGMPTWKIMANKFLTFVENLAFRKRLSEYHTGLRAYSARFLRAAPYHLNADGFVFDTQILVQAVALGFRIAEIPVRCRYFPEASSVGLWEGTKYGLGTLREVLRYLLHKAGILKSKLLISPPRCPCEEQQR